MYMCCVCVHARMYTYPLRWSLVFTVHIRRSVAFLHAMLCPHVLCVLSCGEPSVALRLSMHASGLLVVAHNKHTVPMHMYKIEVGPNKIFWQVITV